MVNFTRSFDLLARLFPRLRPSSGTHNADRPPATLANSGYRLGSPKPVAGQTGLLHQLLRWGVTGLAASVAACSSDPYQIAAFVKRPDAEDANPESDGDGTGVGDATDADGVEDTPDVPPVDDEIPVQDADGAEVGEPDDGFIPPDEVTPIDIPPEVDGDEIEEDGDNGGDDGGPCVPKLTTAGQPVTDDPTCDDADDDCDGLFDEDVAQLGELGTECQTATEGDCAQSGIWTCNAQVNDAKAYCALGNTPPPPELCNGDDDDCDQLIDEGFSLGADCASGVGACEVGGVTVCDANDSTQTVCDAVAGTPGPMELCNDVDDNCDGTNNEGFALGVPCLSEGTGACVTAGATVCTADGSGTVCAAVPGQAQPETCNGTDDDCDGATDENAAGQPLVQSCDLIIPQGECTKGKQTCVDGAFTENCESIGQSEEICDGLDNDCDGDIDGPFKAMGLGNACDNGQVGECTRTGEIICSGEDDVACSAPFIVGATELCNAKDDNCDGSTDEAFVLGVSCTVGITACTNSGVTVCSADGTAAVCSVEPNAPQTELCNGIDDNCNEVIDDVATLGDACTVGLGACAVVGQWVCDPVTQGLACSAVPLPSGTEICNGVDDDCDGEIDNHIDQLGAQCTAGLGICTAQGILFCDPAQGTTLQCDAIPGPAASQELCNIGQDDNCDGFDNEGFALNASCTVGVGECANTGVTICAEDQLGTMCSVTPKAAQPEICDGKDNDCVDGIDNGFDVGAPCTVGVGECVAPGVKECSADGSATECIGTPLSGTPEVCDGKDNDCVGGIDNGLPDQDGDGICDAIDPGCQFEVAALTIQEGDFVEATVTAHGATSIQCLLGSESLASDDAIANQANATFALSTDFLFGGDQTIVCTVNGFGTTDQCTLPIHLNHPPVLTVTGPAPLGTLPANAVLTGTITDSDQDALQCSAVLHNGTDVPVAVPVGADGVLQTTLPASALLPLQAFSLDVTCSDGVGGTAAATQNFTTSDQGLQLWARMKDASGAVVSDASGNNNSGTSTSTTWTAQGLVLNGTSDQINFGNKAGFNGQDGVTIVAQQYVSSTPALDGVTRVIAGKWKTAPALFAEASTWSAVDRGDSRMKAACDLGNGKIVFVSDKNGTTEQTTLHQYDTSKALTDAAAWTVAPLSGAANVLGLDQCTVDAAHNRVLLTSTRSSTMLIWNEQTITEAANFSTIAVANDLSFGTKLFTGDRLILGAFKIPSFGFSSGKFFQLNTTQATPAGLGSSVQEYNPSSVGVSPYAFHSGPLHRHPIMSVGASPNKELMQYDVTKPFAPASAATSWKSVVLPATVQGDLGAGTADTGFGYLCGGNNGTVDVPQLVRVDLENPATVAVIAAADSGLAAGSFGGALQTGQYVYCSPRNKAVASTNRNIVQIDTAASFDANAVTVFDPAAIAANPAIPDLATAQCSGMLRAGGKLLFACDNGVVLQHDLTGPDTAYTLFWSQGGQDGAHGSGTYGPAIRVRTSDGVFTAALNDNVAIGQHTIAGSYDRFTEQLILYLDGTAVKTVPATGTLQVSSAALIVGNAAGHRAQFSGTVGQTFVYDRGLTAAQISALPQ